MSGLNPSSTDLAVSSKREIARVWRDLQAYNKFAIAIGDGVVVAGKEVNPTLGNNFQMEWDNINNRVIIHNDFPIYVSSVYYYIDVINPLTDTYIPLASLVSSNTPYNHFFLVVSGNPNIGNIEMLPTASTNEPSPIGTKLIYIGYVYRGGNDEISVVNFGRLIDTAYIAMNTAYVDYLDEHEGRKFTVEPTNILRFTAFYGPNLVKTITEAMLFVKDDASFLRAVAYSPVTSHTLLASENLRLSWKITI